MSQKSKSSGNQHKTSRLESIRKTLTPLQLKFLNEFWQHFKKHSKWPTSRSVHSRHGKQSVKECLKSLGGDIVFENRNSSPGTVYELTVIGILLTEMGADYFSMLTQYLEFLRTKYKEAPDQLNFSDKDFREGLNLNDEQVTVLGGLAGFGGLWNGGGFGQNSWSIRVPDEIEDLPENGPLDKALEGLLFQRFQDNKPVSIDERQRQQSQFPTVFVGNYLSGETEKPPQSTPVTVDALKRRYQVFVSSTYEDLKEERQHVIQALLETKCIPLGMELFPAASTEQWALIKRVIDECDYYLVVVAGRYGSLNKSQVGYTEMEFDYATSIGKPVIGFYHKSPEDLPGTKLEKTDEGRKRLKAFTDKIRNKLCRPWSSPAELGSAVKSAILNELEFNPKPGWIRADAAPSSESVEKLKQKIADLEEKLKKQKLSEKNLFPEGSKLFPLELVIQYDFKTVKIEDRWLGESETEEAQQELTHELKISWDDLILLLQDGLHIGIGLDDVEFNLRKGFHKMLTPIIEAKTGKGDPDFKYDIPEREMKLILHTLTAKKLIKLVSNSYQTRWRFTPKGLQHVAELQAVKADD